MKTQMKCPRCGSLFAFDPTKDFRLYREGGPVCQVCDEDEQLLYQQAGETSTPSQKVVEKALLAVVIFLLVAIFMFFASGCTPMRFYQSNPQPVKMNQAVYISHNNMDEGYILCQSFKTSQDTLWLNKAGYWPKKRFQSYTTDITFYGKDYSWHVIELK